MSWYASAPTNDFSEQIRGFLRSQAATSSYGPKSIPWQAVELPLVTVLPNVNVSQDRDEVNLLNRTDNTVQRYVFVGSINQWVKVTDKPSVVTALPTTGLYNGLQIVYDTGTDGVRWRFVYDTSDGTTYPWLFIGGPSLIAEVATSETTTSTTYANLATTGPSVTLPLAGDYDVRIEAQSNQTNVDFAVMSYAIGATTASDNDKVEASYNSANERQHCGRTRRKTGLAAATALTCKYRIGTAGTATFALRSITATPVRVG